MPRHAKLHGPNALSFLIFFPHQQKQKLKKEKKERKLLVELQVREGVEAEIGGEVEDEAICSKASGLKYI